MPRSVTRRNSEILHSFLFVMLLSCEIQVERTVFGFELFMMHVRIEP